MDSLLAEVLAKPGSRALRGTWRLPDFFSATPFLFCIAACSERAKKLSLAQTSPAFTCELIHLALLP